MDRTLAPWPVELRVPADGSRLVVRYEDGTVHEIAAELLRVLTPSAERKGHGGAPLVVGGKQDVRLTALHPVGRYAVRPAFSDGHETGLYTFAFLWRLGAERAELWGAYLDDLAAAGLDRARPGSAPRPGPLPA